MKCALPFNIGVTVEGQEYFCNGEGYVALVSDVPRLVSVSILRVEVGLPVPDRPLAWMLLNDQQLPAQIEAHLENKIRDYLNMELASNRYEVGEKLILEREGFKSWFIQKKNE